jgi:adenylyltransferase/sulfurtransferase
MNRAEEVGRRARHVALDAIGEAGQARIEAGNVLVVGAGGIGCAVLAYLAAAGVGRITLTDFDRVDPTNLGRQMLYGPDDVGRAKADVAAERLRTLNPAVSVNAIDRRLDVEALSACAADVDVILDGTDNFSTRFAVNEAAVTASRTLVSGAAIRFEGQLALFGPDYRETPCYRCLYSEADEPLESCAGNGVLGPVPGVVGAMMAVEALKVLAGLDAERGVLRLFDALGGDLSRIAIPKRRDCPVCR